MKRKRLALHDREAQVEVRARDPGVGRIDAFGRADRSVAVALDDVFVK